MADDLVEGPLGGQYEPRMLQAIEGGKSNGGPDQRDPGLKILESTLVDGRELVSYEPPPRQWIVQHRIPRGEVTLFSGRGGLGKSMIAVQLQCAMASAKADWLGYPVTSGASIGLYCEERYEELARRFQAARKRTGVDWEDFGLVRYHCLKGEQAYLADWADSYHRFLQATGLLYALQAHIESHQASLCVLDSLNRLFPGNENDRVQVTDFCRELEQVATTTDCALLLLSHPSKSALMDGSGFSGSTAWESMVRSRFYLAEIPVKEEDKEYLSPVELANRPLRLIWAKGNYAGAAPEIQVERSPDPDDPENLPPIYARCGAADNDGFEWFAAVLEQIHAEGVLPRPSAHGKARDLWAPVLVYTHRLNRERRARQLKPFTSEQCVNLYHEMLRRGRLAIREVKDDKRMNRKVVFVNETSARQY